MLLLLLTLSLLLLLQLLSPSCKRWFRCLAWLEIIIIVLIGIEIVIIHSVTTNASIVITIIASFLYNLSKAGIFEHLADIDVVLRYISDV